MDKDENTSENTRLLLDERTGSVSNRVPSYDTIVFDTKMVKTSTQEKFAATWDGKRDFLDSGNGRRRRVQSWSGLPPDDVSSEIRILRERQVLGFFVTQMSSVVVVLKMLLRSAHIAT